MCRFICYGVSDANGVGGIFLSKSLGITAAAAEVFNCFSVFEAVFYILSVFGAKYLGERRGKDIAEGKVAVAVEAAGNDATVREDTEVV